MKVNGKETSPNSNFDAYPHLTKSATLTTWLCNSDEVLLVSLDTNCVSSLWELTSNLLDWILQLEQDLKGTVQNVIIIGALYLPIAKSLHSSDFNDVFHYQASILDNANVPIQCDAFNQFENVWKISDSFLCQFLYLLGIEQFTRTQVHGIFAKGYRPGQYPQLEGSRDAILRLSSALSHATARYKCIKIDPQVAWNRLEQDATAGCYDNGYKMAQSIYN
uniref:AlNc14C151G7536 protein n=1 Tax=Albugo laibachii Nc14 TaxID=890382 RepID=F0WM25_9STRA|nr:AlNc14C151G7536 [Albugo laibachii Nc14]|eukprot:CCA22352.1 AlNc14C151G7536 [Albugo laibachii Nc14]